MFIDHGRLGTGTSFVGVHGHRPRKVDNTWHGLRLHPAAPSAHYLSVLRPPGTKVFVAVKRIYVTGNLERIGKEITVWKRHGWGVRHVSRVITAFRLEDQIVAILPYHPHEDFRMRTLAPA
jgi:cell division control protein 7